MTVTTQNTSPGSRSFGNFLWYVQVLLPLSFTTGVSQSNMRIFPSYTIPVNLFSTFEQFMMKQLSVLLYLGGVHLAYVSTSHYVLNLKEFPLCPLLIFSSKDEVILSLLLKKRFPEGRR